MKPMTGNIDSHSPTDHETDSAVRVPIPDAKRLVADSKKVKASRAKWGIVKPSQYKRERRRSQILHEIFECFAAAGLKQNVMANYRSCRAELMACGIRMSSRNFSRLFRKWRIDPTEKTLNRSRKHISPPVPPFNREDCIKVAALAFSEIISLDRAVEKMKKAGERRVPTRMTILKHLKWAGAVDSYAHSHTRISRGLAASLDANEWVQI